MYLRKLQDNLCSVPHRLRRAGLACLLVLGVSLPAAAQRMQAYSFDEDYIFWGYPETYLNYQAKIACPLIDRMLQDNPPAVEINRNRWLALVTLDLFLHDSGYTRREALYTFANSRMACMLENMNSTVFSGVRIYKLYNNGFILRTLKTTVAIDLVPGGGTTSKPFLTDSVIYAIADRCDALLVTNSGNGHANRKVADAFIAAGKKVIVPAGLWTKLGDDIISVGADTVQTVELDAMTLHVMPGHAGSARNNIYVMDFQGRGVVAHTGAQDNDADFDWIGRIHNQYDIDVLLTASPNPDLEDMLKGFRPRLVITARENEMENSVDRRESYWATQKRMTGLAALAVPNVIMTWGEEYDYEDFDSPNISSSANKVMMDGVLYIERKGSVYTPVGIKVK